MRAILRSLVQLKLALLLTTTSSLAWAHEQDFAVAANYYQARRWQLAADEFRSFSQRYPQHPRAAEAEFFLAESLAQLGQLKEASQRYEQFLVQHGPHPLAVRALFRWGECSYRQGDQSVALRLLRQFCTQYPEHELNAYALPYLAHLLSNADLSAEATQTLQQALDRFPHGPLAAECLLQLAIQSYRQQQYDSALAHLERLSGEFCGSQRQSEVSCFYCFYWRGAVLLARGDFEDAAAEFQRVIDSDTAAELRPAAVYFRGECLVGLGQWQQAEQQFRALADADDASEWAGKCLVGLMRTAMQRGDHERVDRWAARIEDAFPAGAIRLKACQFQAASLLQRQRPGEAVVRLESAAQAAGVDALSELDPVARKTTLYLLSLAHAADACPEEALCVLRTELGAQPTGELDARIALARASALQALGAHAESVAVLGTILTQHPQGDVATRCRGMLITSLLAAGDPQAAREVFADWPADVASSRARAAAAERLADAAYQCGDYGQAAEYFREQLEQLSTAEDKARGLSGLAWSLLRQGKTAEAERQFAELTTSATDPRTVSAARLAHAELLEQRGATDRALELYAQLIEQNSDAASVASARWHSAQLYERRGEAAAALAQLDQILAADAAGDQIPQAHYLRGWVLRQLGRTEPAAAEFQTVHDRYPASPCWADATYRLAEHTYQLQQFDRSAELVQELVQAEPSAATRRLLPYVLYLQGRLAIHRQQWEVAARWMRQILTEHAATEPAVDAQFWLAEASYQLADYDAAAAQFGAADAAAAAAAAASPQPWLVRIPLRQAQILAARRQWPEALAAAQTVAAESPSAICRREADLVVGRSLTALGRLDDARSVYQRIVDDSAAAGSEAAAIAQWMIGETHLHQKQHRDAIRAYTKVDLLYHYDRWRVVALLQTAVCHELLQEREDARRVYQQLIDQFPDSEHQLTAQQRLQALQQPGGAVTPVAESPVTDLPTAHLSRDLRPSGEHE